MKPGIRGMGDGLLHHGGVDRNAPGAVLIDHAGLLPGPDRLGQQPLHAVRRHARTNGALPPNSPIRPRQRVSKDGSIGGRCWKNVSPVKC